MAFDPAFEPVSQPSGFDPAFEPITAQPQSPPQPGILSTAGRIMAFPLEKVAQVGRFANQGNQDLAAMMAEKAGETQGRYNIPGLGMAGALAGTALGTASQFLMPQNKLGAAALMLPAAISGAGKMPGLAAPSDETLNAVAGKVAPAADQTPAKLDAIANLALRAEGQGIDPHVVMTNEERAIYDKYKTSIQASNKFIIPARPLEPYATMENPTQAATGSDKAAIGAAAQKLPIAQRPGFLAQALKAYPNISPSDAQYALDHPEILSQAKSVPDATADYVKAIGGLQGKVQSITQRLGKTVATASDFRDSINRAGQLLDGTLLDGEGNQVPLTPQDALEGIQSANHYLKTNEGREALSTGQGLPINELKSKLLDFLQQDAAPNIRTASQGLRDAYVREAFSNWLPQNKFGTPNALRSVLGIFAAAKGAGKVLSGNPGGLLDLAAAAAASPKVAGAMIQGASSVGQLAANPAAPQAAQAIGLGLSNINQPADNNQLRALQQAYQQRSLNK